MFGEGCDILADLLYQKLANKKSYAKINFYQFASVLIDFIDESRDRRNRAAFALYESNNGGEISVITLANLVQRSDPETAFGKEVLKIVAEHKYKNIMMKEGFSRKIPLNFPTFNSLVPYSCLIDEFQYRIFGTYIPSKKESLLHKMRKANELRMQREMTNSTTMNTQLTKISKINEDDEDSKSNKSGSSGTSEDQVLPPPLNPPFLKEIKK